MSSDSNLKEFNFPLHLDTEGRVQIGEPAEAQMVIVLDTKSKQIIHGYLDFEKIEEDMDMINSGGEGAEVLLPFEEMEAADDRRDLCEIFENPTFNNNNSGGYDDDHEW